MTQRFDGISKLKNCPIMGEDIRRAIAASRKVVHPVQAQDEETVEPEQVDRTENASDLPAKKPRLC